MNAVHHLQAMRRGGAQGEATPLPPILAPSEETRSKLETVLAVSSLALVGVIVLVAVTGQDKWEKGADGRFRKAAAR